MPVTAADIEALDAAIARSELVVQIDGRRVEYKSTDELIKARTYLAGVVSAGSSTPSRRSYQFRFTTQRGD